jgi:hypothetical protein
MKHPRFGHPQDAVEFVKNVFTYVIDTLSDSNTRFSVRRFLGVTIIRARHGSSADKRPAQDQD